MKSKKSTLAVGIDLGTTFSSIAVFKRGKPEVIPNSEFGERLTPSVVYYDSRSPDVTIGKFAEEWGLAEITNVIYDTKRLMGRKYEDVYVQDIIKNKLYAYKLTTFGDDNLKIEVKHNNKTTHKLPEEVGCEILKYLKQTASVYLGGEITEAVISVPAHFSNAQRNATKKAAELAGLKVLNLISEPVAAAVFYGQDRLKTNSKLRKSKLLVFDFGGGTLDISVVDVDGVTFQVNGIEGDSFLGGRDLDRKLKEHFFPDAVENVKSDQGSSDRHLFRVNKACTKLKIMLSSMKKARIPLDHFGKDQDNTFSMAISQEDFEDLSEDIFRRAIDLVTQCLNDLKLTSKDIDQVILVGGSSRVPKIQKMLGSYFGENKLKTNVNPDEAVALGAAIQAAIIKASAIELENFKIIETTPLSIGTDLEGGLMCVGIKKNAKLPTKSTVHLRTSENDESDVINIYEGERKNCKYNTFLGSVSLENLNLGRAGDTEIDVEFSLDNDGILTVEAWETLKGDRKKLRVNLNEHKISQCKVKSVLADAVRCKDEDDNFEKCMLYRAKTKIFCSRILYDLEKISEQKLDKSLVRTLCNDYMKYADDSTDKNLKAYTLDNLKGKFQKLKANLQPHIKNVISVKDETIYLSF